MKHLVIILVALAMVIGLAAFTPDQALAAGRNDRIQNHVVQADHRASLDHGRDWDHRNQRDHDRYRTTERDHDAMVWLPASTLNNLIKLLLVQPHQVLPLHHRQAGCLALLMGTP